MLCKDAEPAIARYADDESSLTAAARAELLAHLGACAACKSALDEQREVAAVLRRRPAVSPQPGLAARVSARIDREDRGSGAAGGVEEWFGLANWRRWTAALAPVAAALIVGAYIDLRSASSSSATSSSTTAAVTLDEWAAAETPAAVRSSATGEELIEAVLTGTEPSSGGVDAR